MKLFIANCFKTMRWIHIFINVLLISGSHANWNEWWTYDGISGPDFWGVLYPKWKMCQLGKRQSPVNIDPAKLVFDPYLRPVHVDKHKISGTLYNTGQSILFRVEKGLKHHVNISGGPLIYKYRFEELYIHFGESDVKGSEHHINGNAFPAEVQLYGFNIDLYRNMSEARLGPNGITAISLLVLIDAKGNDDFRILSNGLSKVRHKGEHFAVRHLSLSGLIPDTRFFLTYDGSTTHPGCWETTTWIIINKPLYLTSTEISTLRSLMQGDRYSPKARMVNNYRPIKSLNHRTIRTNIDFTNSQSNRNCPSMQKRTLYAARQWPNL